MSQPPPIRFQCAGCKEPNATIEETVPLCPDCQANFTTLRLPKPVTLFLGFVGLVTLYGIVRTPFLVSHAIADERQQSATNAHVRSR